MAMQYTNHTFRELVHYLDLTSTDPTVRLLVEMIQKGDGILANELIEEGMNPADYTFEYQGEICSAGEYVRQLRRDLECAESDLSAANWEIDDLRDERDKLKTRSVMDLIREVERERTTAREAAYEAKKESERLQRENAELTEKINVWKVMES